MISPLNKTLGAGIAGCLLLLGLTTTMAAGDGFIRIRRGWVRVEPVPPPDTLPQTATRPRTAERTVTFLLGARVRAQGGEIVGHIEDFVIGEGGVIEYAF